MVLIAIKQQLIYSVRVNKLSRRCKGTKPQSARGGGLARIGKA